MSRQSKLYDGDTQKSVMDLDTKDSVNDMIELVVMYDNDREYVPEEIKKIH